MHARQPALGGAADPWRRLLFVLVILAHERRRVAHVAVTAHPTAAWTAQQLREAFPWDQAWQNPFVERVIGSIRRECLDHVIVWNERALPRHLQQYVAYYIVETS